MRMLAWKSEVACVFGSRLFRTAATGLNVSIICTVLSTVNKSVISYLKSASGSINEYHKGELVENPRGDGM